MIKYFKSLAIVMIIIGILCCMGGFMFSQLADANSGAKVSSMHYGNSSFTEIGTLGGNKEGKETSGAMSILFYALGGILLLTGVIFILISLNKENTVIIRQNGVILEKENGPCESAIVEFDDHSRKKFFIEPSLIVLQGDKGEIGYKGNLLVEFNKKS